MRAAVLREAPGPLEVTDVRVSAPGPGEVLVRTAAAGLCHSDLHIMDGALPSPLPVVLGHEAAGVVEKVGEGVRYVTPGDRVVTCVSVFCGACAECLSGHPYLCLDRRATRRSRSDESRLGCDGMALNQFFDVSAFGELMLVHQHAVVKIRRDMPLDRAAVIGCAVTTGLGAVFRTARVEPGSSVAVIGCGGIGLNCVQGARIAGAGQIVAVDTVPAKLKLASAFGATDVVDAGGGSTVEQVLDLTGGGVDYAFEAIGTPTTVGQAWAMLRRRGTATVIGVLATGQKIELPATDLLLEKRLQGCFMGSNRFRVDIPRYVEMYLGGQLNLDDLVSQRIGLDQINDGFEDLRAGRTTRSIVAFDLPK
jgi:S-(hydroxymethyl)glutathione dehydrogenase/alcohol dehydrogenase